MRLFNNVSGLLTALWRYRGFILSNVKREFQLKYRNSLLGAAWTVINPLAMITVYTVVFSRVMHSRLPGVEGGFAYSIFLCAGILTWGLFAELSNRLAVVFIENANLIKKINFPRICLLVSVALSCLLNFTLVFVLFLGFLLLIGEFPGWALLNMLPLLLLQLVFSMGVGVLLGVVNVFFRDVGQMLGLVLQFWFWLTPIVYPASILPEWAQALLRWNPVAPLFMGYQTVLLKGGAPDWSALWPLVLLSIVICAMAIRVFRHRLAEMVDEL